MSNIRVSYSGLISFIILMISIFTGLIFTIIVTRRLEQVDFALWSLIGGIVAYSLVFAPVTNYWVNRHSARSEKESITGIFSSLIFSILGTIIYLIAAFYISETSDINFQILLFGAILIPIGYLTGTFNAITAGYKPQGNAFGILIFEIIKIPTGFLLVYVADMGVIGAIMTSVLANSAMLIFYSLYLKEKLKESFHGYTLKNWFKLSWIPIMAGLHDKILHLDSTIFTIISGSIIGVSYVGVAKAISNLISNASSISVGLAPKLLATQEHKYVEIMFERTILFAIPILGFVIVFAKSGLWILNPIYTDGIFVVYLWAIIHFIYVIYGIFYSTLMGLENIDVGFNVKISKYLKSRLFTTPLVYIIGYLSYIITLGIIFWISVTSGFETLETVFLWGSVGIIINLGIMITFWIMVKKTISIKLPIRKIIKYFSIMLITMIIINYITTENLEYQESIFDFIPNLLPYVFLYIIINFGLVFLLDKNARVLVRQIFRELKK